MDLKEALDDLAERSYEATLPATWKLTDDELKDRYLDLISDGVMSAPAARELGKTGSWFRKFRNPEGPSYDEEFTLRYDILRRPHGEYEQGLCERTEAALVKAAEDGNVRAQEKILAAYHPNYSFLRPTAFTGDTYNVDKLVQIMPGIPTHLLEQMREALLESRKELPPGEAA